MATQLLVLKGLASVCGGVAIGGGSYAIYHNSGSIKSAFGTQEATSNTAAGTKITAGTYKFFSVRYKEAKGSATLDASTPITCTIGTETAVGCKIYKFGTTPKLDNTFTTQELQTLQAVTTPSTDFADNTYFVVELTDTSKAVSELKNKTITLKTGSTDLGKFTFDQLLSGETTQTVTTLAAIEETYIVKKSTTWNASAATSYGCKLTGVSPKIDNYDSSCKLIKLSPSTADGTFIDFAQFGSLNTKIQPSSLATDTATDSFYKLIVNKNLLYNLEFDGSTETAVQLELFKDNSTTAVGSLEIQQKFSGQKFIGKTKLLLAKPKSAQTSPITSLTNAKCSFTSSTTVVAANQFGCTLTKITSAALSSKNWVFDDTVPTTLSTFTANTYFVINLTEPKNIEDFDNKPSIYYQISADGNEGSSLTKNIEFEIATLMSGEASSTKKPIFLKAI